MTSVELALLRRLAFSLVLTRKLAVVLLLGLARALAFLAWTLALPLGGSGGLYAPRHLCHCSLL